MREMLPNILITMSDDQRATALSCDGSLTADAAQTPHLDALSRRGVRFLNAYHAGSASPAVCSPSRAMLHTGRGPFDVPADMVDDSMAPGYRGSSNAPTLGQLLTASGYATHFVGKWHNGKNSFQRGFASGEALFFGGMDHHTNLPLEDFDGESYEPRFAHGVHSTDQLAASATSFLKRYASGACGDQPFCLTVAFTAPHDPRQTHTQWHDRYPADAIDLPENFTPEHPIDYGCDGLRDELLTPQPRDPGQTRHEIADYYAMVEHLDHAIGRIHGTLESLGLNDNTLVIHTSDHGLAVGQHGLMGKQNLYEHSIGVPLVLAGPNVPAGTQRGHLVYQHDLFPTLLESAGAGVPADCGFESLWPIIADGGRAGRAGIGCFYRDRVRAFRSGDQKVILYKLGSGETVCQQFDLAKDPWEQNHELLPLAEVDGGLRESLRAWQHRVGDPEVD
ncbi:MAG: sulfatase-like hydrolase/transferase [Planctomycetota bacterium]